MSYLHYLRGSVTVIMVISLKYGKTSTSEDTTGLRSVVGKAVMSARGALSGIAIFSAFINILMLTGPLYMLQVYDRVLISGSAVTLLSLSMHSPLTTFQRCGSSFQAMRQELFSIFPGLLFISP